MNAIRLLVFVFLFISFPVLAASVSPGDLIITEVMANPDAVTDSNGEWFEIHNLTGISLDLNGLTISDNDSDLHVINNGGPLVIDPLGYLVLGNNTDSTENGGYTADYEYSDFTLANSEDEIIIYSSGMEIVRLEYSNGFVVAGKSQELSGTVGFPLDGSNYVASTSVYGAGDRGTPGGPGDSSWNLAVQPVPIPAAAWLFCSGLMGLFGLAKKRPALNAGLNHSF